MQTSSNTGTLQWLIGIVLLTSCHQTWHLILGEIDLLAAEGSKTEVRDLELGSWCRHGDYVDVAVKEGG